MGVVEPQGRGGKSAIGACDDVLASDESREPNDPFRNQFRMFHEVRGVADHTRDKDFPLGQLYPLEDVVFVFVPRVCRFERIGSGIDL